jgi:hypothetical protein
MNKKTLLILLSVFLVLLIGATFPMWKKYVPMQKKAFSVTDAFNFSALSEQTSKELVIQKGDTKKVFTKNGSDWFLDGKKVVFENIRLFFEGLQKAETKERVAKNPENHVNFGVTKEMGYTVAITDVHANITTYIIGNSTPGETTYYMRKDGSNDVYTVTSVAFYKLSDAADAWVETPKEEPKKEEPAKSEKKK